MEKRNESISYKKKKKKLIATCQDCNKDFELYPKLDHYLFRIFSTTTMTHQNGDIVKCSCGSKKYKLKIKSY